MPWTYVPREPKPKGHQCRTPAGLFKPDGSVWSCPKCKKEHRLRVESDYAGTTRFFDEIPAR